MAFIYTQPPPAIPPGSSLWDNVGPDIENTNGATGGLIFNATQGTFSAFSSFNSVLDPGAVGVEIDDSAFPLGDAGFSATMFNGNGSVFLKGKDSAGDVTSVHVESGAQRIVLTIASVDCFEIGPGGIILTNQFVADLVPIVKVGHIPIYDMTNALVGYIPISST
jgi:hypothetical protein